MQATVLLFRALHVPELPNVVVSYADARQAAGLGVPSKARPPKS